MKSIQKYLQAFKDMSADSESKIGRGVLDPLVLATLYNSNGIAKADLGEKIYYSRSSHKSGLDKPLLNLIAENLIEKRPNEDFSRKKGDGAFYYFITKKGRELIEQ